MLAETFTTPLAADLTAVAVGSLQGALFAAGFKRIDLLGVAIIGIASGVGGGFLRDILLGTQPAVFSNNWYLVAAIIAAFIGMGVPRLFRKVDPLINAADAVSLGLFGAIGATKALSMGLPVIPALFIGTVSAVGGGVIRDVLLNIPIALMHVGSLYAVAAMGGIIVLLGMLALEFPVIYAAIACVVVTTVIRLLAVRFGWSLPEQRALSRIQLRKQRQVEEIIDEALQTGAITIPIDLLVDPGAPGRPGGTDSGGSHRAEFAGEGPGGGSREGHGDGGDLRDGGDGGGLRDGGDLRDGEDPTVEGRHRDG